MAPTTSKVHPEMREATDAAMRAGLKWWRTKTPAEIRARLRAEAIASQNAIMVAGRRGLEATMQFGGCRCGFFHRENCTGKWEVVFHTPPPKPALKAPRGWQYVAMGLTEPVLFQKRRRPGA